MDTSSVSACFTILMAVSFISNGGAQSINTTHGEAVGLRTQVLGKTVDVYYGLPFAKPPIDDLRFRHPEPVDHWRPEVKDARAMKPSCQQAFEPNMGMPWRSAPSLMSEDCLYINAWVPAQVTETTKLTTMVWIYGGAFIAGSNNQQLYSGKYLAAEQNVIVMSMNYRIGALGFLYMGPDTFPGNQGMLDQVLALEWIYNNVERFGGDRKSITIFGESAGGASVSHHLLSPLSKGYFTRAIIESGSSTAKWAYGTTSFAKDNMNKLAQECGCLGKSDADIYNCMKAIPHETIIDKQMLIGGESTAFGPVVDGYFLPDIPEKLLETGQIKNTEILLGVNNDEGTVIHLGVFPSLFSLPNKISISKSKFQTFLKDFTGFIGKPPSFSKAIAAQYQDTEIAAFRNYTDLSEDIFGDNYFQCPAVGMAASFSRNNPLYLYSFEHKLSAIPVPQWIGASHSFELEFVFGLLLGNTPSGTDQEVALTRQIMQYWTQFAKTGDPNLPNQPTVTWPKYDLTHERYLVLDIAEKMTTRQGLRKKQCVFWNTLVPMISECDVKLTPKLQIHENACTSRAVGMATGPASLWITVASAVLIVPVNLFLIKI